VTTSGGAFFDQFIEDYFAECDEHLAAARRVLLALESAPAGAATGPQIHELLRSLHTLKGLSGMVGDTCAERMAHALEDAVRGSRGNEGFTAEPAMLDALFAGIDAIERCVAAHRAGEPPPDVDALVASLVRIAPGGASPIAREPLAARDDSNTEPEIVFHFEFVPTATLTARGVGVDAVRTRLRATR